MKKNLTLLVIAFIVFESCKNEESTSVLRNNLTVKQEFDSLTALLKTYDDASQLFTVTSSKKTIVKGKIGTIILIDPSNLKTENGQTLGKTIVVELKELSNQNAFLKSNVQTVSDGKLLISGGAYYINMTSDGQQLELKSGSGFTAVFPKLAEDEMSLFYGQPDSLGLMNWKESPQKFEGLAKISDKSKTVEMKYESPESDLDSTEMTVEQKKAVREWKKYYALEDEMYKAIEINRFGWINCDRFYDIPNKTTLHLSFNPADSIVSAIAYLIFEDINSVMQYSYFSTESHEFNGGFTDIPVDAKAKVVVVSLKNSRVFSYSSAVTIEKDKKIELTMKEIPRDGLANLFNLQRK